MKVLIDGKEHNVSFWSLFKIALALAGMGIIAWFVLIFLVGFTAGLLGY